MSDSLESSLRSLILEDYGSHFSGLFREAHDDSLFYSGEQWPPNQLSKLLHEGRRASTINVIKRRVDKLHGFITENFKDISIEAAKDDEQILADDYNNLINRIYKKGRICRSLKGATKLSLITGLSYLKATLNIENPDEPHLTLQTVPFDSVIFAPHARVSDWEDTEYIVSHRVMSREELTYEFPKHIEKIISITSIANIYNGFWTDKNTTLTSRMSTEFANSLHELTTMYRLEVRTNTSYLSNGLGIWVTEIEMEQLSRLGDTPVDERSVKEKAYLKYEFVDGKLLFVIREPFAIPSIFPVWCYTNETAPTLKSRLYGVVRNLKGIQVDINVRNSQAHDIVESQIQGGWIYKEGEVGNPEVLQEVGQGKVIAVTGDVVTSLRKIEVSQIPPSHAQSIQMLVDLATEASGIGNEDLITGNNSSGLSIMLQQASQNQHINSILENVDDALNYVGRLLGYIIQLYDPQVIAKVLGKDISEIDPRLFIRSYVDGNLSIIAGKSSNTQRAKSLNELLEFRKVGLQISDELIVKYSSITNKAEVIKSMQASAEAAAEKEAVETNIKIQKEKAEIESESSSAFKDKSQGIKNLADATETAAETNSL